MSPPSPPPKQAPGSLWALNATHTRTAATGYPQITFSASFSRDRGEETRGRGRGVGLMEEEGGMLKGEVLQWAGAHRTKQSTLDLQATPLPFKTRVQPRQGAPGNCTGQCYSSHQHMRGLDKGFLSCPSVSPAATEEIGPSDPLRQPSHHPSGPGHLHLSPELWLLSRIVPTSVPALLQPLQRGSQSCRAKTYDTSCRPLLRPFSGSPLHETLN